MISRYLPSFRSAPRDARCRLPSSGSLGLHFPTFAGLNGFYKEFAAGRRKPFAIAEWAIWGADAPAFAGRLFDWIGRHKMVRMVHYNQGAHAGGIFRLSRYPPSSRLTRRRSRRLPATSGPDCGVT